jgi:hypothetical protein
MRGNTRGNSLDTPVRPEVWRALEATIGRRSKPPLSSLKGSSTLYDASITGVLPTQAALERVSRTAGTVLFGAPALARMQLPVAQADDAALAPESVIGPQSMR